MWKTDNNSELNKLYKDVKINKYIYKNFLTKMILNMNQKMKKKIKMKKKMNLKKKIN